MTLREIHIHVVSDVAEGAPSLPTRAATALYPGAPIVEHVHPRATTPDDLRSIFNDIERRPGIVFYRLGDPAMARAVHDGCAAIGCRCLAMPTPNGEAPKPEPAPGQKSAVRLRLEEPRRTWLPIVAGSYAVILTIFAMWLLTVALIRPTIAFPPVDSDAAETAAKQTGRAHASALIGVVRGELWADYAFALASVSVRQFEDGEPVAAPQSIEPARAAARRAAELSPHDSRVWLLLAALDTQVGGQTKRVPEELKTSYYTGPNENALRPLRLRTALAFDAIAETELQSLVTLEIQAIVMRVPALKPSIAAAYLHGSAEGRRFLDGVVPSLDPGLSADMHKAAQPQ